MKIYFVDSENIGNEWINLYKNISKKEQFYVFYTKNNENTINKYSKIINEKRIKFIKCKSGKNALDFQLSSFLGFCIQENKKQELMIISNDKGYDSIVSFWKKEGIKISRKSINNKEKINMDKKEIFIKELSTIVDCFKGNKNSIYFMCTHLYGEEKGKNAYKEIKANKFKSCDTKMKETIRKQKICELIINNCNNENAIIPKDLITSFENIIKIKEPKNIEKKLLNKYGQENGIKIYRMIKPFYKIA